MVTCDSCTAFFPRFTANPAISTNGPAGIQLGTIIRGKHWPEHLWSSIDDSLNRSVLFITSIFLVIAQLRQYPKIKRLTIHRALKVATVIIVLLPLLLMPFIQAGEPTANTHLNPTSGGVSSTSTPSTLTWDNLFQKTYRTFDSTTGLWTYTIALSNQGETATILHVWAGFETIAPLGTRVTIVDGPNVSASDSE
jgi:hypothetical protein